MNETREWLESVAYVSPEGDPLPALPRFFHGDNRQRVPKARSIHSRVRDCGGAEGHRMAPIRCSHADRLTYTLYECLDCGAQEVSEYRIWSPDDPRIESFDGGIVQEDILSWLCHVDLDGPAVESCALGRTDTIGVEQEDFGLHAHCRYQFFGRTNGLVGHKKYPKKRRPRSLPTAEQMAATRKARNARHRNKPENRAKFYAWRNEHRRKKREAGIANADVDRRQAS